MPMTNDEFLAMEQRLSYRVFDLNRVAKNITAWREGKGFKMAASFEDADLLLSKLALVHTEVSEAATEVQKGTREKFAEELADAVIRILDIAGALDLDLEGAIEAKMLVNEQRAYRHGGKRA